MGFLLVADARFVALLPKHKKHVSTCNICPREVLEDDEVRDSLPSAALTLSYGASIYHSLLSQQRVPLDRATACVAPLSPLLIRTIYIKHLHLLPSSHFTTPAAAPCSVLEMRRLV